MFGYSIFSLPLVALSLSSPTENLRGNVCTTIIYNSLLSPLFFLGLHLKGRDTYLYAGIEEVGSVVETVRVHYESINPLTLNPKE